MLFLVVLWVIPEQMHVPWLSTVQQRSYAKTTLYLVAARCSMSPQRTTLPASAAFFTIWPLDAQKNVGAALHPICL